MSYTSFDEKKYRIANLIITLPAIIAIIALLICRYVLHVVDDMWIYFYAIIGIHYFLDGCINWKVKKFSSICSFIVAISFAVLFFVRL